MLSITKNCGLSLHEIKVINVIRILHFEICFFYEICQISWNQPNFIMKSTRFHHEIHQMSWNLPNFIMKSAEFHEIHWIPCWNLTDFMKDPKWAKDQWSYFSFWYLCPWVSHMWHSHSINECGLVNEYIDGVDRSILSSCWVANPVFTGVKMYQIMVRLLGYCFNWFDESVLSGLKVA